jgi:hypothetical protein
MISGDAPSAASVAGRDAAAFRVGMMMVRFAVVAAALR